MRSTWSSRCRGIHLERHVLCQAHRHYRHRCGSRHRGTAGADTRLRQAHAPGMTARERRAVSLTAAPGLAATRPASVFWAAGGHRPAPQPGKRRCCPATAPPLPGRPPPARRHVLRRQRPERHEPAMVTRDDPPPGPVVPAGDDPVNAPHSQARLARAQRRPEPVAARTRSCGDVADTRRPVRRLW
jgi:hypothetical protein